MQEFGAYFQAQLADELRRLGVRTAYDKDEKAVVLEAVPQGASDAFSKGRKQVLRSAKAFAAGQGLDWDELSAERKLEILRDAGAGRAPRQETTDKNDREFWREQAEADGLGST